MELSVFGNFFDLPNVIVTAIAAAGVQRYSQKQQMQYDREMLKHTADRILLDLQSKIKEAEQHIAFCSQTNGQLRVAPFDHDKFISAAVSLLDDEKLLMGNKAKDIRHEFITLQVLSEVASVPCDSHLSKWLHSTSHYSSVNSVISQSIMQLQQLCALAIKHQVQTLKGTIQSPAEEMLLDRAKQAVITYRFNKMVSLAN